MTPQWRQLNFVSETVERDDCPDSVCEEGTRSATTHGTASPLDAGQPTFSCHIQDEYVIPHSTTTEGCAVSRALRSGQLEVKL